MSTEVLSGLKVLVALAKADGVVHDNERLAIENALDGVELPDGATVDSLLASEVDLDAELANITSPAVRQQTFDSACALVFVDGEESEVERVMLDKVRDAFAIVGDTTTTSGRYQAALARAFAPLAAAEAAGSSQRRFVVDDEIHRFSVLGAGLAAVSLPGFCNGIQLQNEVRLAQKIGAFYGRRGDPHFWQMFVGNLLGAASSRLAIGSLAKLAGLTAASRSTSAFASTFAIGKATKLYFEKEESIDAEVLRGAFRDAKREGLVAAKDAKSKIDEKRSFVESAKHALDAQLASGKLNEADYEGRLVGLD